MRFRNLKFACALLVIAASDLTTRPCAGAPPRAFTQEVIPAAPSIDARRLATIEAVRFGFDGYMTSDAWSPVRVFVSGNPSINTGAFAGTLTLDFAQDASQSASITTSFATTPGRIIPVEIIAAIPRATPTVRLQLHDQSGRLVHEKFYWQAQFGETQLPAQILDDVQLVVVIADKSGAEPSIARALQPPEAVAEQSELPSANSTPKPTIDERLAYCVVRDEELPTSEFGFKGVAIVAARSDVLASLPIQKLAALSAWIQSGGCLVVLAGADPQSWLARFWDAPPIEILDSAPVTPDPDLVSKDRAGATNALTGRVVRLTQPIAESGWRIDWGTIKSVRHDGEPIDGLLAQGPAGFGWIAVLGIDPALLGNTSSQLTLKWKQALRHALAEAAHRRWLDRDERWQARSSGQDDSSRLALRASLDRLADIPALGDGAFITIAAFLVLLALAIGPFDAIILQRAKLRAWSWATALGWIALASVLAAVVPPLVRSGDSTSHRLRAVDFVQSPASSVRPQQLALTTLFANASSNVTVFDPQREKDPPIGWFRGISASHLDDRGRSAPLATFATIQSEFRLPGASPERLNAPSPASPLPMGQWTLRSFQSTTSSPLAAPPVVRVTRKAETWEVTVSGLTGKRVEGQLRIGSDRFDLPDRELVPPSTVEFRSIEKASNLKHWDDRLVQGTRENSFSSESTFAPGTLLELPGTRDRARAIDALLASGGWACVYLFETDNSPSLDARANRADENFKATESTLWRILLPLDPDDRQRPLPLPSASISKHAPAEKTAP